MRVSGRAPAAVVLPELLRRAEKVSARSTVRQREWALFSALEHVAGPSVRGLTSLTVRELVDQGTVDAVLAAAAAGQLRSRGSSPSGESPRSLRARAAAFRWLAGQVRLPRPATYRADSSPSPVDARMVQQVRVAVEVLSGSPQWFFATRAAAVLAVLHAGGLGSAGLCGLRVEDVDESDGRVRVPAPAELPASWIQDGQVAWAPIASWGVPALREWLSHRAHTLQKLEGGRVSALWVSGHANAGGTPPGMPLRVRGLVRAHRRTSDVLARRVEPVYLEPALETLARAVRVFGPPAPGFQAAERQSTVDPSSL